MPDNVFIDGVTVREVDAWRRIKGYARDDASVWTKMRAYARRHGRAVAVRADDSVIEYRYLSGRVAARTFKPGAVTIDWPGKHSEAIGQCDE